MKNPVLKSLPTERLFICEHAVADLFCVGVRLSASAAIRSGFSAEDDQSPEGNYVAIGVIGQGPQTLRPNVVNAHLDAAATEAEIRRQRDVHRPIGAALVEDNASGPAVVQRLRMNVPGVIEINPEGACCGGHSDRHFLDRQVVIQLGASRARVGRMFLPESAPWSNNFVDELAAFPRGTQYDCVNSVAQALSYKRTSLPLGNRSRSSIGVSRGHERSGTAVLAAASEDSKAWPPAPS